jgi:hypothetical protein
VFDRIHCSFGRFIIEFSRFISKIGRYSSVGDFTVHIFNQMDFDRFLPNFTEFDQFFRKSTESEGGDFLVSTGFLNTGPTWQTAAGKSELCETSFKQTKFIVKVIDNERNRQQQRRRRKWKSDHHHAMDKGRCRGWVQLWFIWRDLLDFGARTFRTLLNRVIWGGKFYIGLLQINVAPHSF